MSAQLPATFTLIDGTVVNSSDVIFTPPYTFTLTDGTDETENMRTADKNLYDGFDITAYNNFLFSQQYANQHGGAAPPALGSTSTLDNFVDQITTNPLAAPIDALNSGVKSVFTSSGVNALIITGAALVAAVIIFGPQFRKGLGLA